MISTLIFDFDGTLVDSAPGILRSFALVLDKEALEPMVPVDEQLIGPPLAQTMSKITGVTDADHLRRLVDVFKGAYDSEGYKASTAYPGLRDCLAELSRRGYRLVIVTNKRRVPTLAILNHLEIDRFFAAVYTPDTWEPAVSSKIDTLAHALRDLALEPGDCLMIGDSIDDAHAAAANGLGFIGVSFGYGTAAQQDRFPRLRSVASLHELPESLNGI